jgi:hypothetical protein
MQWIICTKKVDCVDQEMTGPFETYDQAMAVFTTMMRPASDYEHKYIVELFSAAERARISGVSCCVDRDHSRPADLERVPAEWREALLEELIDEVNDMSSRELAFLLLEAMDQDELDERVRELAEDFPDSAVVHH